MIFNRTLTLATTFSLALTLITDAYGQSPYPANSLRRTEIQATDPSGQKVVFSLVFDPDRAANIDFELLSESIAEAVISDQQLADHARELDLRSPPRDPPTKAATLRDCCVQNSQPPSTPVERL